MKSIQKIANINEIAFFGLPSVLIPYPYVRRHQLENAQYLCENNAAVLIEEEYLTPENLRDKIVELSKNANLRESMSRNVSIFSHSETDKSLEDLVLNV